MAQQSRKRERTRTKDLYLNSGILHNWRGNYAKAVEALQKAVAFDPSCADAHSNLGVAHLLMENCEKAIPCFEKALSLDATDASVYYKLGNAYVEAGRFEEAKDIATAALEFKQDLQKVHYVLGRAYTGLNMPDKALHHFQTSRELATDKDEVEVDFDFVIGRMLAALGEFDRALEHFQKSLARDAEVSTVHAIMALVYVRQGKFDEAQSSLADALLLNPLCDSAHYVLEKFEEAQHAAS